MLELNIAELDGGEEVGSSRGALCDRHVGFVWLDVGGLMCSDAKGIIGVFVGWMETVRGIGAVRSFLCQSHGPGRSYRTIRNSSNEMMRIIL